ncbi:GNAT family N-acetyltransferase [Paenibacillus solisilvae]|uniref:GNAT family N-acetyltransferase n=1 Tax=Paenibacillus solisilvae TaxID=2486751 RepID=A0ABW0W8Q6_9BACL
MQTSEKPPILVRRAALEDSYKVLELWKGSANWLHSKGIRQWDPAYFTLERVYECFHDGSELYVGEMKEEIVGTLLVGWSDPFIWEELDNEDSGYIHRFAVSRDYLGLGIGTALLEWAENYIWNAGKNLVRLDCMADNERLNQYYQDHGFTFQGVKVWENGWKSSLYEKI